MSNLREMLVEELSREGVISFARFMKLALYCPNFGYYEQAEAGPGQQGDFYTSVSVGELFGELLAWQFAQWLETMPARPRQILEAGAHDGKLAADILRWLQTHRPELAATVEYLILEPSVSRRKSQAQTLAEFGGAVKWFESWNAVSATGIHGIIFSNELLDAMPVHRLGWDSANRKWFEWGVRLEGNNFAWARMELNPVNFDLPVLPAELMAVLPGGFTTEICPAATQWWQHAARALKSGSLIAFDYGLMAEQFFMPERREGTLRAYHRHHQNSDVLARVGEQDITAQVNFSAIRDAGEVEGLRTESLISQSRFLTKIVADIADQNSPFNEWTPARTRQFQTLTHPEHLGRAFQVLIQTRLA